MNSPCSSHDDEGWDQVSPLPLRRTITKDSGVRIPRMLIALDDMDDDVESCSTRIDDGIIIEVKAPLVVSAPPNPIRQRRTNAAEHAPNEAPPTDTGCKVSPHQGPKHRSVWDEFRDVVLGGISQEHMDRFRGLLVPFQRLRIQRRRVFRCGRTTTIRLKRIYATLILLATMGMMTWAGSVFLQRRAILKSVTPFDQAKQRSLPWTTPAAETQWAVFYNVYISPNPILSEMGRLLVKEQLGQVASSYAASGNDLIVYVAVIGQSLHPQWLHDACASGQYNLTCIQTTHSETVHQSVLMTRAKEYCHDHPDQAVIYLHNKGSLDRSNNGCDRWRRTMTAATTSQLCLAPAQSVEIDQCSTCGMLFQTLPMLHYPGNMWTAKCSYINQVLSPNDFRTQYRLVDEWLNTQIQIGLYTPNGGLFQMEEHYTGHEDNVMDYWLGSNPDMLPCDVSKTASLNYWLDEDRDFSKEFTAAQPPRHDVNANWNWYSYTINNSTLTDSFKRKRDFFLLRGMIYRYMVLYNRIPQWTSWIWDWFPDGDLWREDMAVRDPWVAVNTVIGLPGTTKIEDFYMPVAEQEGVSDMRKNIH